MNAALTLPRLLLPLLVLVLGLVACDDGGNTTTTPVDLGPFPQSSVKDCANNDVDLSAVFAANDITYVTMGAKWCTACREEVVIINNDILPNIPAARTKVVQLLLEDNPGQAPPSTLCDAWVTDLSPQFDIYADVDQSVVSAFYNGAVPPSLPEHILVNREGTIVFQELGALPKDFDVIINDFLQ